MVKTTINIPNDTQERLKLLSDYFNKDINEIVSEIVEVISYESGTIIRRGEEYKIPIDLTTIVTHICGADRLSTYSLFNVILEELGAKGYFIPSDMTCDLDETSIWVHFDGLVDSPLLVDSFDVWLKNGMCSMRASYSIHDVEVESDVAEKLREIVKGDAFEKMVPKKIYDLDDWNIHVEGEEDYVSLVLDVEPEYLGYLPPIPTISSFFKKICKTAKIKSKNTHTT